MAQVREVERLSVEEMRRGNDFTRRHGLEMIVPGRWAVEANGTYYRIYTRNSAYVAVTCADGKQDDVLGRVPFAGSRPEAFARAVLLIVNHAEGEN